METIKKFIASYDLEIKTNTQQYEICEKTLREIALPQIQNLLQNELHMNDPQLASAVCDFYGTRYQEKANTVANLKGFFVSSLPKSDDSWRVAPEALEKRLEQNFNVGTQILLLELLREAAKNANVSVDLRNFLKATQSIDHFMSLYGKVSAAMAGNFTQFIEQTSTLDPQVSEAVTLLEQTIQSRGITPRFVMQNNGSAKTAENDDEKLNKSFR